MPKLIVEYNSWDQHYAGHHIKEAKYPHVPVAVVLEPIGGFKVNGKSPIQQHYATLLAAAPELRSVLARIVRSLDEGDMRIGPIREAKRLLKRTEKEGQ